MIPAENEAEFLNRLSNDVIGAAIETHRHLGPGLLESVYETCLLWELRQKGLGVEAQAAIPIRYKGLAFEDGLRIDLLVERMLILELKSVERVLPIHTAQALTYLKMTGVKMALVLNFTVALMRTGIKRVVHEL